MNKLKDEDILLAGGSDDEEDNEEKKNEDSDEELEEEDDLEEEDLDLEEEEDNNKKTKKIEKTKKTNKIDYNLKENMEDFTDDFSENDYEDEEDSDVEEDDNVLQKFNENLNTKFLEDIHIETKSINYDEMIALSKIVRDKTGKIIDPLHTTLPFLTKYEKARVIGARAEQLDRGGEAFIPLDENIINGRTIALMEFEAKKIPFILARPLPNGSIEYWHLSDLEIL